MSGVQCENFVGNAWKKDLCLNCFKSKEEHAARNGDWNPAPTRIPDPPKEGILKGAKSSNQAPKGNKVIFLNTEYEVIGFGGDDVYSDEEDYPEEPPSHRPAEDDDVVDSEEDRAFQKLTKTNTDYNSIPENLQEPKDGEIKKLIEPLKLGKQVFDDKGNKKTLLVSVTPFGDQTSIKNKINSNGFCSSPAGKENKAKGVWSEAENLKSEDTLVSEKEKTETSVNNENEETCKSAVDIAQIGSEDISGKLGNEKSLKRSQPLDKNFRIRLSKENERIRESGDSNGKEEKERVKTENNNVIEKESKKTNQFPIITGNQSFKFRTKDLTNSLEKKLIENKAVVLDMYNIRENVDVKRQNEINQEKTVKSVLASPETRGQYLPSLMKMSSSAIDVPVEGKKEKVQSRVGFELNKVTSDSATVVAKDKPETVLDRSKLVPNVSSLYRHHLRNIEGSKSEGLVNGVIDSTSPAPSIACGFLESEKSDAGEKQALVESALKETEVSPEAKEPPKEEKFKKTLFENFENFERIIKGEEITLFSAEERREETSKDLKKDVLVPDISRESAGEPDGRADSDDLSEPPALPLKPPPPLADSRNSFFVDLSAGGDGIKSAPEKPKVPAKPIIIHSKKINFQSPIHPSRPKSPSMEKFLDVSQSPLVKGHTPLQESLSSDLGKNQKRPAPKPPSPLEESSEGYAAVVAEVESDDSGSKPPEAEEKTVRRISRSTENLLEFISSQEEKDQLSAEGLEEISVPEPVPRRSLSLSQDSLMPCEPGDAQSKKKPSRGRFFLRKLLHLGKPKESGAKDLVHRQKSLLPPTPKPKLEIIHPSDLSGSRVEVVPPARSSKSRRSSSSASSSSGEQRESDVPSDSSASHSVCSSGNDSHSTIERAKKPPPPPRNHSLETWTTKPARPPPPKSVDVLRQADSSWSPAAAANPKSDSLYVNLGEARSGLAPNKPIRTGSLREANMENGRRLVAVVNQPEDSDYESFVVAPVTPSHPSEDNLYECVQVLPHRSSLPECDSSLTELSNANHAKEKKNIIARNNGHRRSEGNVDFSCDYFKMKFNRSVSLPYCASETESEIYSPYSFYGSELGEDDYECSASSPSLRMSRLKLKKGRSIVHKNLEDNYGAVVVANHEALAQVAEQMRQGPTPPPALRALSTALNLRWSDFTISKDCAGVVVERRIFYPALWGAHGVTLSLAAEQGVNSICHAKGPFNLNPLAELNDLVPASYLPQLKKDDSELVQASISVLTRLQIETVELYGKTMRSAFLTDESKKEINFVLLQIVNAFKTLQAQGIEEAPKNLTNLIVCREEKDPHPRICITHSFDRSEEEAARSSLCQCVAHALNDILPPTDLTALISSVLLKEKAVSLSQTKGILEFTLWGPADICFGNSNRERESALQRWLDLERATVLHGLVRTRAELTVFEEWQLLFLVRTNAKMMAEASLLLESGLN